MDAEPRGGAPFLAGWLWADILLGLFVIFLAASSAPFQSSAAASPSPTPTPRASGIEPAPHVITLVVNGAALLGSDASAMAAEQVRITGEVSASIAGSKPGQRVAMILAYGTHEEPLEGDRLVRQATALFPNAPFGSPTMPIKRYHELVPGDRGSRLTMEVFLFER